VAGGFVGIAVGAAVGVAGWSVAGGTVGVADGAAVGGCAGAWVARGASVGAAVSEDSVVVTVGGAAALSTCGPAQAANIIPSIKKLNKRTSTGEFLFSHSSPSSLARAVDYSSARTAPELPIRQR
jgi:hypothetical protein